MLPFFTQKFGNAASKTHQKGWQADEAVKNATLQVAGLVGAKDHEIIFTSGATESCNLALIGVWEKLKDFGNHIITCVTEHKAVLDACSYLETRGAEITYLPVDKEGHIDLEELKRTIKRETILLAFMYANNEIGTLHPVAEIGSLAKEHKIYFFCDATQAVGKIPIDVKSSNIDLLALSAHKFYGPKGVGALYINRGNPRVQLSAMIHGGGHQQGWRSGTLNVPGIVGLGAAAEMCQRAVHWECFNEVSILRDTLENGLLGIGDVLILGDRENRLGNVTNLSFKGVKAERLLAALHHEIAFSLGSACTSAQQKASHVLTAMQLDARVIDGAFRLSLGKGNTTEEIEYCIAAFKRAVDFLRSK